MDSEEKKLAKGSTLFEFIKIKTQNEKFPGKKRIKKCIKNIFFFFLIFSKRNIIEYIILAIPFILIDYFIREENKKFEFEVTQKYSYLFSYSYIMFYLLSSKAFKGNIGKYIL